ncbi:MAG TPA: amidohydrolase [Ferruginibacter sp.]|nr:amidohydrolase [Ferruginibacter sp.]
MLTANRQRLTTSLFIYLLTTILFSSCNQTSKTKADLIIYDAKIYTVDSGFSVADAMAIKDGKILAIGHANDILSKYDGATRQLSGKVIFPGFIDAHSHFMGYAASLENVNLVGTKSWQECIDSVKRFANVTHIALKGKWIKGRGWDQNDWDKKEFPTKELLDAAFPENPVALTRIDGHALIANQMALDLAHIKPGQTIEGGTIETKDGKLTGIMIDNAKSLINDVIPPLTKDEYGSALYKAQSNCFAVGLTTVSDCGLDKSDVDMLDALQKEQSLKMKVNVMVSDNAANYDYYFKAGPYKTDRLNVSSFKLYADGALGSRGACLLDYYSDKPGWRGFLLKERKYFDSIIPKIYDSKFQACTHAIGDSGNRMILQVYASVLKGKNDRRWRVEHAQVISPPDFHYFGDYDIIPSVQPTHATSDMYWAKDRLGNERVKGAYAYKQLLDENNWIPLGTDFPVEDISPLKTFYAAVVRQDANGFPPGGFQFENALSRIQTIMGMTIWAAKASFEEKEKGSLEVGKYADFVILDNDLMTCLAADILKTKVKATYVNGQEVFSSY